MYTTKQKGFTIVELLIVIVVIAILAAISLVAFTGIQQRGRDSERSSDVSNIIKALTAMTTDEATNGGTAGVWPADASEAQGKLGTYQSANLGEIGTKLQGTGAPTATNADQYSYKLCAGGSGAIVAYWSESKGEIVNQRAGSCADSDEFPQP